MADAISQAPEMDARLAEIDRRLREIQGELVPLGENPPADDEHPLAHEEQSSPPVPPPAGAEQQIERLTALQASLLSSMTDVLAQLQAALAQVSQPPEFSISAGPFASLEALRAFERELARLPGVREVAVRGYEGDDRAVIDVQLLPPNT